jgi:hypothetical protein
MPGATAPGVCLGAWPSARVQEWQRSPATTSVGAGLRLSERCVNPLVSLKKLSPPVHAHPIP